MGRVLDALGPGLDPLDRPAQHPRHRRDEVVLGVGADLAAEASSDVLRDDPYRALRQAQGAAHEEPDEVRVLARHPDRQLLVVGLVLGDHPARLHRRRSQALLEDPLLHHHLGTAEGAVGGLPGDHGDVPANVVGEVDVDLRAVRLEGLLQVHHGGKGLVVDLDQVGRVIRCGFGVGEHHGHDLALVGGLAGGDREPLRHRLLLGREGGDGRMGPGDLALEILRRVDGSNARGGGRLGDVDLLDLGVRVGAAHEGRMNLPRPVQVVDVAAVPGDQPGVFAAMDLGADQLSDGHRYSPPAATGVPAPLAAPIF